MRHLKFFRLVISLTMILLLVAGCTGNIAPMPRVITPTAISPTPVVVKPSETPSIQPEPGASGIGDSLYLQFGNSGYDVQHYTLDLTIKNVATSDLVGDTTIEAEAAQNLSSFNLDFIGFKITDITVNGQPA